MHGQHSLLNEAKEGKEEPTIFLKEECIWEHGQLEVWETKQPRTAAMDLEVTNPVAERRVFVQGKKPGCPFFYGGAFRFFVAGI